jgi:hypothetical protein
MGRLGLFLIRIVVWATGRLSQRRQRPEDYLRAWAAQLALAGVTVIGSVVDWLTVPAVRHDHECLRTEAARR